jgi:hypothetical protein
VPQAVLRSSINDSLCPKADPRGLPPRTAFTRGRRGNATTPWMGGVPPLGYQAQDRKLGIIDSEAEIVRSIFRRYAELGSVRLLKDELEARRIDSRSWTSASGRLVGGKPFSRGAFYLILQNRIP